MSRMPKKGYSGGRLLALGLAEAIARVNIKTEIFVDNIPEMYDEFRFFSKIKITPTIYFLNILIHKILFLFLKKDYHLFLDHFLRTKLSKFYFLKLEVEQLLSCLKKFV